MSPHALLLASPDRHLCPQKGKDGLLALQTWRRLRELFSFSLCVNTQKQPWLRPFVPKLEKLRQVTGTLNDRLPRDAKRRTQRPHRNLNVN